MEPKISVIIPLYNAQAFIIETLQSVLNQTYPPYEIIVINDGSTDNSLRVAKDFAQNHSLIKVYDQNNSGPSATRNNGVAKANGNWICFVDADDLLHPQRLEIVKQYPKCDVIICNQVVFSDSQKIEFTFFDLENTPQIGYNEAAREVILKGLGVPSMIFKKSIFDEGLKLDSELLNNEDFEFHFRLITQGKKFVKYDLGLYFYRSHQNSERVSLNPQRINHMYRALYKIADQIDDLPNDEMKRLAKISLANRLANNALKQALKGDNDYKNHLLKAKELHKEIKPYRYDTLSSISNFFGNGNIEFLIGKTLKYVRNSGIS